MTEIERKKSENCRVFAETLEKLKDEQYRLRKAGLPVPTYAELVEEAWALYERQRDQPADKVVTMPASKRDQHSVTITVPPEIAKDVQRIADVLRGPGALEQFNALMRALSEDTMGELARSFTAAEKKRKQ